MSSQSSKKRAPLTRARILAAAVAFVDREGLEALSMRRLGAELGVEAMSLYNHIPNKAALLDGMVESILRELETPVGDGDWEEKIRDGYRRFRRLAHRHPSIFPLLVNRPPRNPDGLWLFEVYLQTMEDAGFEAKTSFHAFRTLTNYTFGYAMAEIRGFALEPSGPGSGEERLEMQSFPRVAALAPSLENLDHDSEFEFGLDLILGGLKSN